MVSVVEVADGLKFLVAHAFRRLIASGRRSCRIDCRLLSLPDRYAQNSPAIEPAVVVVNNNTSEAHLHGHHSQHLCRIAIGLAGLHAFRSFVLPRLRWREALDLVR